MQAICPFLCCVSVFFLLIGKGSLFMVDQIFVVGDVYCCSRNIKFDLGILYPLMLPFTCKNFIKILPNIQELKFF